MPALRALFAATVAAGSLLAASAQASVNFYTSQAEFDKNVGKGFRLAHVSGYKAGAQTLYAAIWDKSQSGAWVARHGMSSPEYQDEFNVYVSLGYRLMTVSGF